MSHNPQMAATVTVNLPGREYEVVIGENLLAETASHVSATSVLGGRKRCVIVTDSQVGPLYAEAVEGSLTEGGFEVQTITVPSGEPSKSFAETESICRDMIRHGHDRNSFLVALGGGVVGDLAGFAAAVFFRGIPFVQIPTTIVSQVDSSVGGKTGINTQEGKNLVGAFHQPALVIADTATLQTLPDREYNEGFAEVIKHAAIRDADMLEEIEQLEGRGNLAPLIERNVRIKAAIVEEDEKELSGTRALLNFGHTIGHGIEASAGYGDLLHGEAISLGLVAAARISCEASTLSEVETARLTRMLRKFNLPLTLSPKVATAEIMQALSHDKKFREGGVRFVLLRSLGDAYVSSEITLAQIEAAIEALR